MKAQLEAIPAPGRGSFAVREFLCDNFPRGWHFHPEIELTAILSSSGRRFVGDHAGDYRPGDVVLIGSNVPHYWTNDPELPSHDRAHSVVIQFRDDCFGPGFWDLVELRPIRKLLERARRGLQFHGALRDPAVEAMRGMLNANGLDRMLNLLGILRDLAEDPDVIPLSSPEFAPRLDDSSAKRVAAIHDYVSHHYRSEFNHRELAEHLGMSPSALSHYFRRTMGTTLTAFVAEVRIGQACRQLILTNKGISEIAFECGFESLSSFNSWFRKLRKMSPREFRRIRRPGDG